MAGIATGSGAPSGAANGAASGAAGSSAGAGGWSWGDFMAAAPREEMRRAYQLRPVYFRRDAFKDRRADDRGRDRIDRDVPFAGKLLGQRLGQGDDRRLGRRVVHERRVSFLAGNRGHVHDPPVATLEQPGNNRLAEQK